MHAKNSWNRSGRQALRALKDPIAGIRGGAAREGARFYVTNRFLLHCSDPG